MTEKKKKTEKSSSQGSRFRQKTADNRPSKKGNFPKLTANQEQALLYTVGGLDSKEIANKLGITLQTLYHWRSDKAFKKALEEEEIRIIGEMRETLRFVMVEAFNTLKRGIIGPEASPVLAFQVLKETGYLPIADEKFAEKKNVKKQIELFLTDLREFLKDSQTGVYENDLR